MTNEEQMRKVLLVETHGTPEKQKDALVSEILDTFGSPDRWPMDDRSRVEFLKRIYLMAKNIDTTQRALRTK